MDEPTCKKHPNTKLVIRKGKRNQNFVVCPECKPGTAGTAAPSKKEPAPTPAAPEKKNQHTPWYDRPLI